MMEETLASFALLQYYQHMILLIWYYYHNMFQSYSSCIKDQAQPHYLLFIDLSLTQDSSWYLLLCWQENPRMFHMVLAPRQVHSWLPKHHNKWSQKSAGSSAGPPDFQRGISSKWRHLPDPAHQCQWDDGVCWSVQPAQHSSNKNNYFSSAT